MLRFFLLRAVVAVFIIILDLSSKFFILKKLETSNIVVTSFFNLVLYFNKGISFGMFASSGEQLKYLFIFIALLIVIFLFFWQLKSCDVFFNISMGLIIGGALGNVIDRALNGFVIDFLDFHIYNYHWPAFNIADTFIFCGVSLFIYLELRKKEN